MPPVLAAEKKSSSMSIQPYGQSGVARPVPTVDEVPVALEGDGPEFLCLHSAA